MDCLRALEPHELEEGMVVVVLDHQARDDKPAFSDSEEDRAVDAHNRLSVENLAGVPLVILSLALPFLAVLPAAMVADLQQAGLGAKVRQQGLFGVSRVLPSVLDSRETQLAECVPTYTRAFIDPIGRIREVCRA
jgi:hypothetical protein